MTLDMIIKIVFSASIGFIMLNSLLRYHFSSERFITFAAIILLIVLYFFRDGLHKEVLGIIIISVLVVTLVVRILFDHKKDYGYFLLNLHKEEYNVIIEEIHLIATKLNIKKENISFNDKFPRIIYIKNEPSKTVKTLIKEIDTFISKRKKVFTMSIYWHFIIGLSLIAMIWRF